ASRLKQLEDETDIEVFVINGNHDVNNFRAACSFASGEMETVPTVSPDDFKYIYSEFGYNDEHGAVYYTPPEGKQAGGLSYTADLNSEYRLLALDTGMYSADATGLPEDGHITAGRIDEDLMVWALAQLERAESEGVTMIAMAHHGFIPHFSLAAELAHEYVIENWRRDSSALADAGLRYVFTGHMHANDVAEFTTVAGKRLVDVETAALVSYGTPVRTAVFERGARLEDGTNRRQETLTLSSKGIPSFTMDGTFYPDLSSYTLENMYSRELPYNMIMGMLRPLLRQAGENGILPLIQTFKPEFDLSTLLAEGLSSALGGGMQIELGSVIGRVHIQYKNHGIQITPYGTAGWIVDPTTITDAQINAMVMDALDQLRQKYIVNDAWITSWVRNLLNDLITEPLYEGAAHDLYDLGIYLLTSHYRGGEQPEAWVTRALDELSSGRYLNALIDKAVVRVKQLLNEILDNVYLRLEIALSGIMLMAMNNKTNNGQLSAFLAMMNTSGNDIVDGLVYTYLTDSFLTGVGTMIQTYAGSFAYDDTQDDIMDGAPRVIVFSGDTPQAPSVENGLLPTQVTMST
ncbi:MAG: hypothetical protein GX900_03760, partial [Clostridiaceae bacterium]|nr:hypothetical protein [Clostridiaceae bacterium]